MTHTALTVASLLLATSLSASQANAIVSPSDFTGFTGAYIGPPEGGYPEGSIVMSGPPDKSGLPTCSAYWYPVPGQDSSNPAAVGECFIATNGIQPPTMYGVTQTQCVAMLQKCISQNTPLGLVPGPTKAQ